MDAIVSGMLMTKIRQGNTATIFWHMCNRIGWKDTPTFEKRVNELEAIVRRGARGTQESQFAGRAVRATETYRSESKGGGPPSGEQRATGRMLHNCQRRLRRLFMKHGPLSTMREESGPRRSGPFVQPSCQGKAGRHGRTESEGRAEQSERTEGKQRAACRERTEVVERIKEVTRPSAKRCQ